MGYKIRPMRPPDHAWARQLLREQWGSDKIVTRGVLYDAVSFYGYVAVQNDERVGLLTFRMERNEIEILSLNSLVQRQGIGSNMIGAVSTTGACSHCRRIWLITTNDNLPALKFYQKRGFHLVAVYPNALEQSRKVKPSIPPIGLDGIALRDEIELELLLRPPA